MMTKEKNDLNQESEQLETMYCTFKEIKDCGHYEQCTVRIRKFWMDKSNLNNNYCIEHQALINEINAKRRKEALKKQTENINEYWNQSDKLLTNDTNYFLELLNNGEFND